MKIALVYCPAIESSGGPAGPELVMPPIGICSLSSCLRQNGYPSDLFDLLLEFDTSVLYEDFRLALTDQFTAIRSDKMYDPAVLTNLRFFLGLNRSRLAQNVMNLYEHLDGTTPQAETLSPDPVRRFLAQSAEKLAHYDLVGLSVILEEQNPPARILARWIKDISPDTKIVVGGSATRPDDWNEGVDLIVRGDGEEALLSYIRLQDASAKSEAGSFRKTEAEVQFHDCLDALPTPDYRALFTKYQYLSPVKIIPLAVTRGCYWSRCLFCSFGWRGSNSGQCTAPYRRMTAAKVVADIAAQIKENETRYFFFSVDVADPVLLEEIADELLRTDTQIFWSAEVRAEKQFLKPGFLKKLYDSGCRSMTCGYESFNQRVLDAMQKGIRVEDSQKILEGLYEAGIFSNINYYMGWPGETPAEAAETQRAANSVFEKVPGNAAERFVLVQDSPVLQLGCEGTWEPLKYDSDRQEWIKKGMSWSAQNRQWMIFATNFYCAPRYSCLPVRGDGGYGLLYGSHYSPATFGAMFRDTDSSFGLMGRGRLIFYGFFHTRHYLLEMGGRFNEQAFLESCPSASQAADASNAVSVKMERLTFACDFVRAFVCAHECSAAEKDFLLQVVCFDYGLLASCIREEDTPVICVDENGEPVSSPADAALSFVLDFTLDVAQVAQFAPARCIPSKAKYSVQFDLSGFRGIEDL